MSRRPAFRPESRRSHRLVGASIAAVFVATALLPGVATAQPGTVEPEDVTTQWQLLEYRDANG